MTGKDLFAIAVENLWRQKLRAFLTISGVTIGVGMLITMLSFGVGLQQNIRERFERLELFTTVMVLPTPEEARGRGHRGHRRRSTEEDRKPAPPKPLNDESLVEIAAIPGVEQVLPFEVFTARIVHGDRQKAVTVQAVPASVRDWKPLKTIEAGRFFKEDDARELVVRSDLLDDLGIEEAEDLAGKEVTLVTARNRLAELARGIRRLRADPAGFLGITGSGEDDAPGSTLWGLLSVLDDLEGGPFEEMRYPFTVAGVVRVPRGGLRIRSVLVPMATAQSMDRLGFTDAAQILAGDGSTGTYASLTVHVHDIHVVAGVVAALNEAGYHTFSFADDFERIEREFIFFDLFVTAIALVAVVVAALGIMNTLIMAILERTREIGVLKALGAEDRHIRRLFLAEASMIGLAGAVGGVGLGFVVTRVGAFIGKQIMEARDVPVMDPFSMPWWLVLLGIVFGVLVSILAGVYPAHRAAKVDPRRGLAARVKNSDRHHFSGRKMVSVTIFHERRYHSR